MIKTPFSRMKQGFNIVLIFLSVFVITIVLYAIFQTLTAWSWSSCLLISWNIAISCYLVLTMRSLWHSDHAHILQRAQQQDASKWLILFLVFLTLVMCFIAIIVEVNLFAQSEFVRMGHFILFHYHYFMCLVFYAHHFCDSLCA